MTTHIFCPLGTGGIDPFAKIQATRCAVMRSPKQIESPPYGPYFVFAFHGQQSPGPRRSTLSQNLAARSHCDNFGAGMARST
jgi:hypothetical protein